MMVDLVEDSLGRRFAYERLMPTSESVPVVVVPRMGEKYVLLRQFRHALRKVQISFPRGHGEDGLSGEENARKVLFEELGAHVSGMLHVGYVCPDGGLLGVRAAVYLCDIGDYSPAHDEGILGAIELSADELSELIAEGLVDDGFTLSAWALLQASCAM